MSMEEITGQRDRVFSLWRRPSGLSLLTEFHTAIDIDWCEYCSIHKTPLALIEGVRTPDVARLRNVAEKKVGEVSRRLAEMAGIDAYIIAYQTCEETSSVLAAVVRCLHTSSVSDVLNSDELSRFIAGIHEQCSGCHELERNCGIPLPKI